MGYSRSILSPKSWRNSCSRGRLTGRVPRNGLALTKIRCGKPKRGYMGISNGIAGQGAYVRFGRCPDRAFREELVMLMKFDKMSLLRGDGILSAADAATRRANKTAHRKGHPRSIFAPSSEFLEYSQPFKRLGQLSCSLERLLGLFAYSQKGRTKAQQMHLDLKPLSRGEQRRSSASLCARESALPILFRAEAPVEYLLANKCRAPIRASRTLFNCTSIGCEHLIVDTFSHNIFSD